MSNATKKYPNCDDLGHLLVSRFGRKYLSKEERHRFFASARLSEKPELQTFALTLGYTGGRISEILALRAGDVSLERASVFVISLRRSYESWREIPIPEEFNRELELTHHLRQKQLNDADSNTLIWKYSRSTAYRHITRIMALARVNGIQATPQGLRHSFGVCAVEDGVPLPIIAQVMGHMNLDSASVYTTATGNEVREYLKKMWQNSC